MKIEVLKSVTSANDTVAAKNRQLFDTCGILVINMMSSPGAGKTSLILQTIKYLKSKLRFGVIEGDVASRIDAERIGKAGVPVVQINVGGSCSLEAHMIGPAMEKLPLDKIDVLVIENVGNLICPAEFDLGEHKKVVVASLPEGDDKPAKYPVIFSEADVVVINKLDLQSILDFDVGNFRKRIEGLNPDAAIFEVSSTTGKGVAEWCTWISKSSKNQRPRK
jgi:hydrogenase nickel incorporation protein HypB